MSTLVNRRSKPTVVGDLVPGLPTSCRIAPETKQRDAGVVLSPAHHSEPGYTAHRCRQPRRIARLVVAGRILVGHRQRRRADVVRPEDDVADARREARPRRRLEPADEEAGDDDGVVEHR